MKDRVPGAPGQYQAVISAEELRKMQAGEPFSITMTRDDKPVVEGTPYSKAAVLPDELAELICPDTEDPSPADAFAGLYEQINGPLKDNQVLSESATGLGKDNVVGLLGYYFSEVNFENNTVTLSTEQGKAVAPEDLTWTVGDVVSIVNGTKYEDCATITAINGNVLTLDNIPFDELVKESNPAFDDWSIYLVKKPEKGVVDLGRGAVAIGVGNKANNYCAAAIGKDNKVTAQYGMAFGRLNQVDAYAGFASGRGNIVHPNAKYARASGLMNEASGENSVAEGHECKAKARGARAAGYKTVAGGEFSETAGWETETGADASYSFARGQKTIADAWYTFVTGIRTISSKLQGHFVTGRYNKVVSELFTIGCGTSDDNRQNALGVKLDGTTDVYGHKITNVADGTAAGDAVNKRQLDTKAPAGYGLGDYASIQQITTFSSFCKTTEPGWYSVNFADGTNIGGYSTFALRIDRGVNGAIHHLYVWDATNTKYHELIVGIENGNHVLTEWVNPPMNTGVEYRTTERYNGKAVYVKAVELDLSTTGSKYVHVDSGITHILSIDGTVLNKDDGCRYSLWNFDDCFVINDYGNFIANRYTGNAVAYSIVKYTK